MRLVLAFFAASALALLAGCGGSAAQSDPFVGTWRPFGGTDASGSLVLVKVPDGYQGFILAESSLVIGPIPLQRYGQQLVFPAQNGVERQTFTYHADSGRLTDKDGTAAGIDFELVSRSTSHPPASSPQSSPDQEF